MVLVCAKKDPNKGVEGGHILAQGGIFQLLGESRLPNMGSQAVREPIGRSKSDNEYKKCGRALRVLLPLGNTIVTFTVRMELVD